MECGALHQLHRVKHPPLVIESQIVNGHDIRMRELAEHPSFLQKALFLLFARLAAQHHLHRHAAPKFLVAGIQHRAHATASNLAAGTILGS